MPVFDRALPFVELRSAVVKPPSAATVLIGLETLLLKLELLLLDFELKFLKLDALLQVPQL